MATDYCDMPSVGGPLCIVFLASALFILFEIFVVSLNLSKDTSALVLLLGAFVGGTCPIWLLMFGPDNKAQEEDNRRHPGEIP